MCTCADIVDSGQSVHLYLFWYLDLDLHLYLFWCLDLYLYLYCETQPSSIQRLSSSIFPCSSSSFVCPSRMVTSPLYDFLDHTNHTFSESSWSKDIKTDISKCLMHKYTNTNTQIHKYSCLLYTSPSPRD